MKKKISIWISLFLVVGILITTTNSCKKDDSSPENPTNGKTTAVFNSLLTYEIMTDQDGNTYNTITIGTQTWMAENLRTTKYQNGDAIPELTDNTSWVNSTSGAYCNYGNTTGFDTIATYGRLYNGYVISDSRSIAPEGWHVPSNDEWTTLINYLGGDTVAGSKLKEINTTHWESPNEGTTNESGFTALPAGYRSIDGEFLSMSYYSQWWSSSVTDAANAKLRSMVYFSNDIGSGEVSMKYGFSIRCIKDN
jgi:uncharacterized protein (TIGR02145 family)